MNFPFDDFMAKHARTDRDGVPWFDAPLPRRWHRCTAWSTGIIRGHFVDRCACGAIRYTGSTWFRRNSRRRGHDCPSGPRLVG